MKIIAVAPGASYSTKDVYDGIVPELRELGVGVHEYDLEARLDMSKMFLNTAWRYRGKPKDSKYSNADVVYGASKDVLERALRFDVDGVLIFSAMFLHPDALVLLKRAHVRTALILSESPYDDEKQAKVLPWVDVAWTNERSSVRALRRSNPNVNYLPHAYSPEVHKPDGSDDPFVPEHDVVFVGSLFAERVELLSQVDWSGIDLGLYGEWSGLPSRHRLRRYVRGSVVDNRYAAALYRRAKIGLNLYRQSIGWGKDAPRITHAESMNPRTLELAACGTFQLSSYRQEIEEVFGESVDTYCAPQDLNEAVRWYLGKGASERAGHAAEALRRVQPHTFAARARTIVDDLGRAGWPVPESASELAVAS